MEAAHVAWKVGEGDVINGEIKILCSEFAFIRDGNAGRGSKWHLEVSVERFDGSDGQQRGLVNEILAQSEAKEVADGDFHRRSRFSVPPGAQDEVLQVHAVWRVDGEPNMRDHPSS